MYKFAAVASHVIGAFFLLISIIVLIVNARKMRSMNIYMIFVVLLLFSLAITVHGISHWVMVAAAAASQPPREKIIVVEGICPYCGRGDEGCRCRGCMRQN
jgi:hypothetical protein